MRTKSLSRGRKRPLPKNTNVHRQISVRPQLAGGPAGAGDRRRPDARRGGGGFDALSPAPSGIEELTYDEAAAIWHCSPRHARRFARQFHVDVIQRGYRTRRLPADQVFRVAGRITLTIMRRNQAKALRAKATQLEMSI